MTHFAGMHIDQICFELKKKWLFTDTRSHALIKKKKAHAINSPHTLTDLLRDATLSDIILAAEAVPDVIFPNTDANTVNVCSNFSGFWVTLVYTFRFALKFWVRSHKIMIIWHCYTITKIRFTFEKKIKINLNGLDMTYARINFQWPVNLLVFFS